MKRKKCLSIELLARFLAMLLISRFDEAFSQPIGKLEDVSPGAGSTPAAGSSLWGKMLAISATGLESAMGPATSWRSSNAEIIVDHLAAADSEGNLVLFYSYPGSDWKSLSVTEKTNAKVAVVRPESWVFTEEKIVLERLAAPSPIGELLVFTWHAGSDWRVTNLTTATGKKITGPVTSWSTSLGNRMVEHIGARGADNHLLVFWRISGGDWAVVDVTTLTSEQVGDSGASWTQKLDSESIERIAMPSPTGDLILFTFQQSTNWQARNLSQMTGQKVGGPATYWSAPTGLHVEYLAAPAPNGDLVVFYTDPIEGGWRVLNITNITGQRVVGPVTYWNVLGDGASWEHLGGRGNNDHLYVFFRPTGGTWQVKDVTDATKKTITEAPTSWTTNKGAYSSENVAAPSWDRHLHIFTFEPATDWTTADASLKAYGRIVYAASEMAGVWRSRDYGMNWIQMTRPQPDAGTETEGGLDVHLVLDVVASPTDPNLVLAGTNSDNRNPSLTGIYRSIDGGARWKRVHEFNCDNATQPVTQILFAPGDPKTVYAAGGCAIAISNDHGEHWTEVALPGTSKGARVWHLAVSEMLPGDVRRGYACGGNKLWYSPNGGKKREDWYLDQGTFRNLPDDFCPMSGYGSFYSGSASPILAVDPDEPTHVYLADRTHANGRSYFHPPALGPDGVYTNIPVVYDANSNGTYDNEEPVIWPRDRFPRTPNNGDPLRADSKLMFVDGNCNGKLDPDKTIVYDATGDGKYNLWDPSDEKNKELVLRGDTPALGSCLVYDPQLKFVDIDSGHPLAPRPAGEGSLWYGDFSGVKPSHSKEFSANWSRLPGTPVYFGGGSTSSGRVYVITHKTKTGYLVFFSNRESVHVSVGKPSEGGWHRLDALDASASKLLNKKNTLLVHVDPHALTVSPDFDLTLRRVRDDRLAFPYNQNRELDQSACHGRLWIANDGGIYRSDDCGQNWIAAQSGLSTLASHNIAGVAQVGKAPGESNKPPALYFGTGDNDDFFSLDGGKTWRSALGKCGDCDVWYADSAQPNRVWRHPPRDSDKAAFVVFANPNGPPNMEDPSQWIVVDYPPSPSGSITTGIGDALHGGRPIVQTLASEAPLANGDYIAIQEISPPAPAPRRRNLIRAKDTVGSASPWVQVGPDLPPFTFIAQASGGHAATVFYVGDGHHVWRWPRQDGQTIQQWQQVVPGGGATRATRFFANPYDSNEIYILGETTVRRSTDGGITWPADANLDSALTSGGTLQRDCNGTVCVMNDMVFDRNSSKARFALGLAGVFYSGDGGGKWSRLVDTRALPSRPRGAFFDPITDPQDKSLYIAFEGRGIMRYHPIPPE